MQPENNSDDEWEAARRAYEENQGGEFEYDHYDDGNGNGTDFFGPKAADDLEKEQEKWVEWRANQVYAYNKALEEGNLRLRGEAAHEWYAANQPSGITPTAEQGSMGGGPVGPASGVPAQLPQPMAPAVQNETQPQPLHRQDTPENAPNTIPGPPVNPFDAVPQAARDTNAQGRRRKKDGPRSPAIQFDAEGNVRIDMAQVTTKVALVELLGQLTATPLHGRRPLVMGYDDFEFSHREQYALMRPLQDAFDNLGYYCFKQTKSFPTFNYSLGVIIGAYQSFDHRRTFPNFARLKRIGKGEIYNALCSVCALPLGFGVLDGPSREEMLKVLYIADSKSYIFDGLSAARAKLPRKGELEVIVPMSCKSAIRFNWRRLKELSDQADALGGHEAVARKRMINKSLGKCITRYETFKLAGKRLLDYLRQSALLGLEAEPIVKALMALANDN